MKNGLQELPQKIGAAAFSPTGEWSLFPKLMVILALLFLALALFVRLGLGGGTLKHPSWRPILRYSFFHGLILGLVGLLLGFFRYERASYLSSPWVFYLYFVISLIWVVWIGLQLRRIPAALQQQKDLDRKQQWMKAKAKRKKRRR